MDNVHCFPQRFKIYLWYKNCIQKKIVENFNPWDKLMLLWDEKNKIRTYLVKTRHNSVALRIISCWLRADWDFCIARCKSFWINKKIKIKKISNKKFIDEKLNFFLLLTNIFSNECFASQQFRNTGIKRFLIGGYSNWKLKNVSYFKILS